MLREGCQTSAYGHRRPLHACSPDNGPNQINAARDRLRKSAGRLLRNIEMPWRTWIVAETLAAVIKHEVNRL